MMAMVIMSVRVTAASPITIQTTVLPLLTVASLKGIVHNFFVYRSNLIFWIEMGCGIAGLEYLANVLANVKISHISSYIHRNNQ